MFHDILSGYGKRGKTTLLERFTKNKDGVDAVAIKESGLLEFLRGIAFLIFQNMRQD